MLEERKVFVSYSIKDEERVFQLLESLGRSVGTKFWIDKGSIGSGTRIVEDVFQGIKDCQVVLFMISDNSINSRWIQSEIKFAKECRKRVVPVILDGEGLRDWAELYLANVNCVDAKNKYQLEKLSKEITEWIKTNKKQVFVSYSRADKDKVFPLVKTLEKGVGTKFWIDLEGIESTAQFLNVIRQAIKDSQVVLFMLSDNSINGEWTQREIMFAKECGKRVVPVILDGGGLRDWTELYFANVNYVDSTSKRQIEKLSREITEWLEPEVIVGQTDGDIADTPPRSVAIKKVLSRLIASLKTIILVVATLIVIVFVIGMCVSDNEEGQDEESVQDTITAVERDTIIISATEDVTKIQTSTSKSSTIGKEDITSDQSITTSSTTSPATTTGSINGNDYDSQVFDVVEQMPSFPGGQAALMQWLASNVHFPAIAVENGVQGSIIVQFIVEKDGSVSDVQVVKSVEPSLDEEAKRVVSAMPHWIPGKQDGATVRVKYTIPFTFELR